MFKLRCSVERFQSTGTVGESTHCSVCVQSTHRGVEFGTLNHPHGYSTFESSPYIRLADLRFFLFRVIFSMVQNHIGARSDNCFLIPHRKLIMLRNKKTQNLIPFRLRHYKRSQFYPTFPGHSSVIFIVQKMLYTFIFSSISYGAQYATSMDDNLNDSLSKVGNTYGRRTLLEMHMAQ